MRIDVALVQAGLVESREKAKTLIEFGQVQFKEKLVSKASFEINADEFSDLKILENEIHKYVSRAGLKLEGALKHTCIQVKDSLVLDIGQSTGGFTDCLLQSGARQVIGVDVGHGQLHRKLSQDDRCVSLEGINAKNLSDYREQILTRSSRVFDLIVMDVSFISITAIVSQVGFFLKDHGEYLFLVKPQFEVGPNYLDKNGVVDFKKFPDIYFQVEQKIRSVCDQFIGPSSQYFESKIEGKEGNREFFIYGKKK